ncbi:sensor domain-containing protein [Thalassospira xiamenensis]|uniref:sensor domain-containing protein n=1 Tax=Thalassospira xiamenensis TaxID=220697 RepID=UPI000DEE147F|nr:sensor domain-containing diguanylate cyclase [Thalassospira xiamenensis]RCK41389.1 diguanylate cyclase [Thalassospira xiamenensis]
MRVLSIAPDIVATAALSRDGIIFIGSSDLKIAHANLVVVNLFNASKSALRDGTEIKQFLAFLAKNAEFSSGDSVGAAREALSLISGKDAKADLPAFQMNGRKVTWRKAEGPEGVTALVFREAGKAEELAKALADHKLFIQHLIDVLPIPVYLKNLDGVINRCNDAFAGLLGQDPKKVIGGKFADVAPAPLVSRIFDYEAPLLKSEGNVRHEIDFEMDGVEKSALFAAASLKGPSGAIAGTIGSLIDVTSLKQAQAEVAAAAQRLTGLLEKAPIGVGISNRDGGEFQFYNKMFETLLSLDSDGTVPTDTVLLSERYREKSLQDMDMLGELQDVELRIRRPADSDARWLKASMEPLTFEGQESVLWWISDITKQKLAARELQNKANNDELTGLANRARYMQKLSQCETVLRGTDTPASIFLLDLDGFKTVNDTLGHGAGDWVLVETAKRLKRVARRAEEVARLGGDEFTLFFINKGDEKEMAALADDILAEISKPYMWEGNRCDIGASIGFTVFDAGYCDMTEQLRRADKAMYEAKESGKGRACLYRPELEPDLHRDDTV